MIFVKLIDRIRDEFGILNYIEIAFDYGFSNSFSRPDSLK